jgi:hypothetical protein
MGYVRFNTLSISDGLAYMVVLLLEHFVSDRILWM